MIEEIWKLIEGFDEYEVSNHGKVRRGDKILKSSDNEGQMCVALCQDGKINYNEPIHRLVAIAFLPQLPDKPYVCHNDGCYKNNYVSNLRWDTPKSNSADKKIHGTEIWGESNPFSKLSEQDVLQIRTLFREGVSTKEISSKFSQVSPGHITNILRYETWEHVLPEWKMNFFLKRTVEPKTILGGKFIDDRGEISYFNEMDFGCIRRLYTVTHERQGVIRAWHYHEFENKFVYVASGTFLVVQWIPKLIKFINLFCLKNNQKSSTSQKDMPMDLKI